MIEKQITVEVKCFDDIGGDEEFIIPLSDAIQQLQTALDSIPEKHREDAVFRTWGSGESVYPEVYYTRPETDDERRARTQKEQRYVDESEARERATYARLKAKFG